MSSSLLLLQLREQQRIGASFLNFQEADISFLPTYKYNVGTDVFDTSEKMRCPAYCDRILYHRDPMDTNDNLKVRGMGSGETSRRRRRKMEQVLVGSSLLTARGLLIVVQVEVSEYTSCPTVRISDHKPVRMRCEIQVGWPAHP